MIFDSCTFAWHAGQLTISAEEEDEEEEEGVKLSSPAEECREEVEEDEEEVAVAVLCCTAGDIAFTDSLGAAELLIPDVLWKKSEMLDELLLSSHGLFLDT